MPEVPAKADLCISVSTMEADQSALVNRCGYCGSTNYRRVVERNAQGAMRYGEWLVCSGCAREFADMDAWRGGSGQSKLHVQHYPDRLDQRSKVLE